MTIPTSLACFVLGASPALAQSTTAELSGTVSDNLEPPSRTQSRSRSAATSGNARNGSGRIRRLPPQTTDSWRVSTNRRSQRIPAFRPAAVSCCRWARERGSKSRAHRRIAKRIDRGHRRTACSAGEASPGQAIENRKILELPAQQPQRRRTRGARHRRHPRPGFGIGVPDGRAADSGLHREPRRQRRNMSANDDARRWHSARSLLPGIKSPSSRRSTPRRVRDSHESVRRRIRTHQRRRDHHATRSSANDLHTSVFNSCATNSSTPTTASVIAPVFAAAHLTSSADGGRPHRPRQDVLLRQFQSDRNRRGSFLSGITPTDAEKADNSHRRSSIR